MDKDQRKQSTFLSCLVILGFILSAFSFLNMLYAFADCIGSIVSGSMDVALKDFLRSLPIFLCFFMSLWLLLSLQASFRKVSEEKWHKSLLKDSICLIAFGVLNVLYIIIGLIIGKFSSLVEGAPSYLYPLDAFIFSIVMAVIGVFMLLYVKKYEERFPYVVQKRGEIVTKARGLYCTFVTFWMLFALFGLSAGIYSIFIYDFAHEYAFYGVAVVLAYLISPIMFAVWEFYYNELKEEKKRELLLPLALCGLCASIIVVVLYIVSLTSNMDAPSNAGFGMFPVAFAASVNIATLLTVFTPVIVSVVAVIKGLLLRKQKAE